MDTEALTDGLLLLLILLLALSILGCAFWPPHHHRYTKLIAEHWDYEGYHYKCLQCVCGKQREQFIPIDMEGTHSP